MESYCSDPLHIFSSIISFIGTIIDWERAKNLPFPKYAVFHLRPDIFRIHGGIQEARPLGMSLLTHLFIHDAT